MSVRAPQGSLALEDPVGGNWGAVRTGTDGEDIASRGHTMN